MKGPRHLWTGDWRSASHENDEALTEKAPLRAPTEDALAEPSGGVAAPASDEPGDRGGRLRRSPFAVALVVAMLAALGLFAGSLIAGGDDTGSNQNAKAPEALPSVDSKPLKPRKGQTRAGAIYEAASPAVLSVRAGGANGTAFLVDADGTIVTNDHVVEGGDGGRIVVRFGRDGNSVDADLLGTDPSSDLAVLSIRKSAIPKGVKPLEFADSRSVRVGDMVIAIGNPFGLDRTATEGIVSAIGRDIEAPNRYTINNVIQTDAPINPGNSGGPLLDDSAHVIGVNSQIATSGTSQGNVGIGFAVPSNTVRQIVPILKKGRTVRRAYLGVKSSDPTTGESGAQIAEASAGGPAATAGLRVGDVIKSVNGKRITDSAQLSSLVSGMKPGDRVAVVIERGGVSRTVDVTLGLRPASTSSP